MYRLILFVLLMSMSACENKVVDGDPQPPMPGYFERDKDVFGIDSDDDGVRDDLEIWINENGKYPQVRYAMKQEYLHFHKGVMEITIGETRKEIVLEFIYKNEGYLHCASRFNPDGFDIAYRLEKQYFDEIYNTSERRKLSRKYWSFLNGQDIVLGKCPLNMEKEKSK